ncbi:MAG TPA: hypothetical protein VH593_23410, partial [Ktedonobacteraceae bacterium]
MTGRLSLFNWRNWLILVVVIAAALVFVIPLWWTIVWGSWHTNEIFSYPPKFLPGPYLLDNLHNLQGNIDILR